MLHFDQQLLTNLSQTLKLCLILSTGANPCSAFVSIGLLTYNY